MFLIIGKQITQVVYVLTYDGNYYIKVCFGYKEKICAWWRFIVRIKQSRKTAELKNNCNYWVNEGANKKIIQIHWGMGVCVIVQELQITLNIKKKKRNG